MRQIHIKINLTIGFLFFNPWSYCTNVILHGIFPFILNESVTLSPVKPAILPSAGFVVGSSLQYRHKITDVSE